MYKLLSKYKNNINPNVDENNMITGDELKQRQKAVYTYLAKIRNSLYKANDYINR